MSTLYVGGVRLHPCRLAARPAYCGSVRVPLDYRAPAGATVAIGFGWLPARKAGSAGSTVTATRTIVAQEGGPGYPSTGTAGEYLRMLGPLLDHANLLMVDERGTGFSSLIRCTGLQRLGNVMTTPAFRRAVAACGAQLNATYRRPSGGIVQAADLFSTANGARDLRRVLLALHTGPVDLYGDSYGTYFAQSFLARYPGLLRSVTLDSAYEARDLDPWYVTSVAAARRGFDAVCARSAACRSAALDGTSWQRISQLAGLLRRRPVAGTTTGLAARRVHVVVDQTALVNIVNDAGYDFGPYRALDAAARAYLVGGDKQPLLRLWAQDLGWDDSDYVAPAGYFSDGSYMAIACTDYPQLFDMRSAQSRRRSQLARSIDRLDPTTFAPFTVAEWMSMQPYTETYSGCLTWPRPAHPEDTPVPRGPMNPTHVPVLVLNGSLDSLTPAAGGAHVARQLSSAARSVVVPNMVHLVGLDDRYGCGAGLVRRFIARPARLHSMDVTCRSSVPEVHTVGAYPRRVRDAVPAHGAASLAVRRLASVVAAAAGDAANRYGYVDGLHDLGLRGGHVAYSRSADGSLTATLSDVRWTLDSQISGTVCFTKLGLAARARLAVSTARGRTAATVSWNTPGRAALATVHIAGSTLTLPAP